MMKGIKWGFRVLVYKQVWWLNSILNNKASTMMGHTIHSVLNHLKRYFKRNVSKPYLIDAFLICFTLGVYPYWLPATLLATILTKLIWRLLKMKFISSKLKSLCKRLMSQSLDEKVATIRNIRKVLIDTKFYEDNFLFKPTKQEAAFILIRLEQYAPALQLLSEVKGEENEDEGIQLIKALVNHLQDSKPLSDDAKITNHKLEELLDNIIQNKLKADAPKKYEKMPQRFIKNIFDSVSASRYTSNPPRTSKNNRVTSNDRININYDKYFFIPDQSLPYFFNLFGNRFDAPVVNIRGLTNLGNTCYMNSALQCLHKSFQLTSQIKQSQIPPSLFVRVYLQLMDNLSEDTATPFRPQKIKELIGKYNEIFADRAQHDAGELMSTVLSHLSEDLNTVTARKVYKIDASVTRNNDQLLEEYIKRDRYRSHSLIEQLFFGRFLTNYKCLDCNHQQRLFEKFSVLFLPMPARGETDLQACMRSFLVPDRMEGNNAWWCTNCGRETRTDKSMSVYQHSPFLAICLKRFDSNRKVTSLVRFDQQITLRFISHRPSVQQLRYQLYGVINHVGSSLDYGHYFSFCLDGNTWRKYDDERVTEISAQDLVTSNAFVLLYRLIK